MPRARRRGGSPAARGVGSGNGGALGSVRAGETQIARSRDVPAAEPSGSTASWRAAASPGSRQRTSMPRGESRPPACRVDVHSVERSPAAAATVTDIRRAPRRSRQSWGNSIARELNSVSCESRSGNVAVLPAATTRMRPGTPSASTSHLADPPSSVVRRADSGRWPAAPSIVFCGGSTCDEGTAALALCWGAGGESVAEDGKLDELR